MIFIILGNRFYFFMKIMIWFVINLLVISNRDLIGLGLDRIGLFRYSEMEDYFNLEDKRRVFLFFKNFL